MQPPRLVTCATATIRPRLDAADGWVGWWYEEIGSWRTFFFDRLGGACSKTPYQAPRAAAARERAGAHHKAAAPTSAQEADGYGRQILSLALIRSTSCYTHVSKYSCNMAKGVVQTSSFGQCGSAHGARSADILLQLLFCGRFNVLQCYITCGNPFT